MNKDHKVNELFLAEIQDTYDAEQQLIKALPKMIEHATSPKLAKAFQNHLSETEQQVKRLEQIFQILDVTPKRKTCEAMKGLIAEAKDLVENYGNTPFIDAALIAAGQKVEHYEMASYGCLATWAKVLKLDSKVIDLLKQTLQEEKNADQTLTTIAESEINAETFSSSTQKAMR